MDPIQIPPETISAAFPDEHAARRTARALEEAGIAAEQISIAHRNSAVLSAANDPATIRATGAPADLDRNSRLGEPGFFVRSQAEHLRDNTSVLVIVAPEIGQEDLVARILAGKHIERLEPQLPRRTFFAGSVAPTPAVLPHERAGQQPDLWWNLWQRIRFLPAWAKAAILIGFSAALALGLTGRSQRLAREEHDLDRAA
jgi:hypothetical protein